MSGAIWSKRCNLYQCESAELSHTANQRCHMGHKQWSIAAQQPIQLLITATIEVTTARVKVGTKVPESSAAFVWDKEQNEAGQSKSAAGTRKGQEAQNQAYWSSLTVNVRPSHSEPWNFSIAVFAASTVSKRTVPYPCTAQTLITNTDEPVCICIGQ